MSEMKDTISISFVMPMFNEEENIREAIRTLAGLGKELSDDHEIVIVDDASTDNSASIVEEIAARDDTVKLFMLEKNTKFGGAFAKGFKSATKDVILYMDSDMPVKVDDIKESLPLIKDSDIVTGYSRIKKGESAKRKFISGAYNLMVETLFGLNVRDINSGYKIVRRRVVEDLDFISRSPFVDVELFIHARKKGYKVTQFPLVFLPRPGGKSYIASMSFMIATFTDMIRVKIHSLRNNR